MERSTLGKGLFYTRDSEGKSELAPPQYVSWALKEAAKLGVVFTGTPELMTSMIDRGLSQSGNLFLDFAISGNILNRPGFEAFRTNALNDPKVSHLFIPRRDRIARPDDPTDGVRMETELRASGLTIVFLNKVAEPFRKGARTELADLMSMLMDYNTSGEFRRELAQKLIHAKIALAQMGFSIGGEPPYGFRRWLCSMDGTPKRELADREIVKMPGHHVVWLPTDDGEIAVIRRIIAMIKTMPVGRIAAILNDEKIPAPNAGRTYKRRGIVLETSGLWTKNTVRNVATHPALVCLMEYGKRSSGDQMRFTAAGPRELNDRDFNSTGSRITVTNPDEHRMKTIIPGKVSAVITPEERDAVRAIVAERGKNHKGKPRARGDAPNPLGGRIYDMNCGWPMYRYARRGKVCYTCGLYQNSEAACCEHNTVNGPQSTRLVLAALRQQILTGNGMEKLKNRLRQLAHAAEGTNGAEEKRKSLENQLAKVKKQLENATRNTALAEEEEQRAGMQKVCEELRADRNRLQAELASTPITVKQGDPEIEVEAALSGFNTLIETVKNPDADYKQITQLFFRVDAKVYFKFRVGWKGKQKINVPAGGMLTFGKMPPPIPLYEGPVDRPVIRKMIATGESVSPILGNGSPGTPLPDSNVERSAKGLRVPRRCT